MDFKDNLKRIREERGLTQDFIAQEIGISRQSVSKWEKGESEPSIDTLRKLCQILSCGYDELIDGEAHPEIVEAKPVRKRNGKRIASLILYGVASVLLATASVLAIIAVVYFIRFAVQSSTDAGKGAAFLIGGDVVNLQAFTTAEVNQRVIEFAAAQGKTITVDSTDFIQWKNSLLSLYSLYGTTYWTKAIGDPYARWWFLGWATGFFALGIGPLASAVFLYSQSKKDLKKAEN